MSKSVVVGGAREQMLTQGEDAEIHALARRGWSISAIARHKSRGRDVAIIDHEPGAETQWD